MNGDIAYLELLAGDLNNTCIDNFHRHPFTYTRWSAKDYSLSVAGSGGVRTIPVASYIPYSGETSGDGLQASLFKLPDPTARATTILLNGQPIGDAISNYDIQNKIVVVLLPKPTLDFEALAPQAFFLNYPDDTLPANLSRVHLSGLVGVPQIQAALKAGAAAGLVAILPYNSQANTHLYVPFPGTVVGMPGVYLSADAGGQLEQALQGNNEAEGVLTLTAEVDDNASTDNLVGVIPGASDREIAISSHTDGTNVYEDNGPAAMVAITRYLCKIPVEDRPVTVRVVLHGGHFAGNAGLRQYVESNRDLLEKHVVSAIEIEHLGAREVAPQSNGTFGHTGLNEPALVTLSNLSKPPVDEAITFSKKFKRTSVTPRAVLSFGAGDEWTQVTDLIQFVTGTNYLLSYDEPDTAVANQFLDYGLMRDQTKALVQMILNLAHVPASRFSETVPDPTQSAQ